VSRQFQGLWCFVGWTVSSNLSHQNETLIPEIMKTLATILMTLSFSIAFAQSNSFSDNTINEASFEVEENQFLLSWETFKEVNTSYFLIEASTDGTEFNTIASRAAKGYSQTPSNYEFELPDTLSDSGIIKITLVNMEGKRVSAVLESFGYTSTPQIANNLTR